MRVHERNGEAGSGEGGGGGGGVDKLMHEVDDGVEERAEDEDEEDVGVMDDASELGDVYADIESVSMDLNDEFSDFGRELMVEI